jgi:MEDS: MEthanogen/methylotroph, DcmR Sensory domain
VRADGLCVAPPAPPSGLDGVELRLGDHICCFYSGADERDRIMLDYLAAGVRHGDKCICLVDSADPQIMKARVERRQEPAPEQLLVQPAAEAYLRQGRFSRDAMISYLDEAIGAALGPAGFPLVRATGEMTWVLPGPPGAEELFAYEAALNDFAPRYPQVLLCMYDVQRFGAGMLVDAVVTHPRLLVGNLLVENPWFTPSGWG